MPEAHQYLYWRKDDESKRQTFVCTVVASLSVVYKVGELLVFAFALSSTMPKYQVFDTWFSSRC